MVLVFDSHAGKAFRLMSYTVSRYTSIKLKISSTFIRVAYFIWGTRTIVAETWITLRKILGGTSISITVVSYTSPAFLSS